MLADDCDERLAVSHLFVDELAKIDTHWDRIRIDEHMVRAKALRQAIVDQPRSLLGVLAAVTQENGDGLQFGVGFAGRAGHLGGDHRRPTIIQRIRLGEGETRAIRYSGARITRIFLESLYS